MESKSELYSVSGFGVEIRLDRHELNKICQELYQVDYEDQKNIIMMLKTWLYKMGYNGLDIAGENTSKDAPYSMIYLIIRGSKMEPCLYICEALLHMKEVLMKGVRDFNEVLEKWGQDIRPPMYFESVMDEGQHSNRYFHQYLEQSKEDV